VGDRDPSRRLERVLDRHAGGVPAVACTVGVLGRPDPAACRTGNQGVAAKPRWRLPGHGDAQPFLGVDEVVVVVSTDVICLPRQHRFERRCLLGSKSTSPVLSVE
jgi:hypothetical protein